MVLAAFARCIRRELSDRWFRAGFRAGPL